MKHRVIHTLLALGIAFAASAAEAFPSRPDEYNQFLKKDTAQMQNLADAPGIQKQ